MPMFEPLVAMITSQQPSTEALPAKQRPEVMPIIGATPDMAPQSSKPRTKLPPPSVSPGRPPPPSQKNTVGMRCWIESSISRSILWWL
jgi:hypothetical protein